MSRQKLPKSIPPKSSGLRAKDPDGIRAEIAVLRERTTELVSKDPRKAAILLEEWLGKTASAPAPKKRAA
jgi:hypothetical protein